MNARLATVASHLDDEAEADRAIEDLALWGRAMVAHHAARHAQ